MPCNLMHCHTQLSFRLLWHILSESVTSLLARGVYIVDRCDSYMLTFAVYVIQLITFSKQAVTIDHYVSHKYSMVKPFICRCCVVCKNVANKLLEKVSSQFCSNHTGIYCGIEQRSASIHYLDTFILGGLTCLSTIGCCCFLYLLESHFSYMDHSTEKRKIFWEF